MKAAIYPGEGKPIVIEDLPDPEPGPDDVIIKVHRCGICGTDLSMTEGEMWDYAAGGQFGHEYAGEIVEVGKDVTGFKKGERIAVLPSAGMRPLRGLRAGQQHPVPHAPAARWSALPNMPASRPAWRSSCPDAVAGRRRAGRAAGGQPLRRAQVARIQPGDRVLVLGGGTVALYAIYWARRLGAGKIVAMSRSDRRKDLALEMGADAFVALWRQ